MDLSRLSERELRILIRAVRKVMLTFKGAPRPNDGDCLLEISQIPMISVFAVLDELTPEIGLAIVKRDPRLLSEFGEQTEELCLEAVKQNGLVLEHVMDQTLAVCIEAVKQNPRAVSMVRNPYFVEALYEADRSLKTACLKGDLNGPV